MSLLLLSGSTYAADSKNYASSSILNVSNNTNHDTTLYHAISSMCVDLNDIAHKLQNETLNARHNISIRVQWAQSCPDRARFSLGGVNSNVFGTPYEQWHTIYRDDPSSQYISFTIPTE